MRTIVAKLISRKWGLGGHDVPCWAPEVPNLHQFLNKSRDAIREIRRGRIQPRSAITAISGRTVTFADGSSVDADHIILATGFDATWPFLDAAPSRLYKKVFDIDDPTLAFAGFARPVLGSIPSLSELQSRWIAHVWSGRVSLPSRERCERTAAHDEMVQRRWFLDRSRLGVLVDQEVYATTIASFIGADVRWGRILFTNPLLFWQLLLLPWTPFKYRLNDRDPIARENALRSLRALVPAAGHPVHEFKYYVGLIIATPVVLAAGIAALLPVTLVPAILGVVMLVATAYLRATEIRPRRRLETA
jgi:hypothetical protein